MVSITRRAWFWNERRNSSTKQAHPHIQSRAIISSNSPDKGKIRVHWLDFRADSTRLEPPLSRFVDWTRLCLARQTMLRFGRTVNSRNWRMVQIVCPYVCRRLGCHLPQPPSIVVDNISSAGSFVLAEEYAVVGLRPSSPDGSWGSPKT